ncbi:TrmH family RNA methyltransferase [Nitrospira moscoviensis]|uniref:Putative 23S rRNA methyltransferase RlmB n=1 Tax=Nitrospira moscoviensis TaxID=42253 RepID=A0A0K2GFD9_NITMO|nr:RNA methyltransferase [Nitrospira moscoviensis]ALA59564.1 putative 23S rRNA methyltransferase RlmB [Nitrospira moscoviensis]
MGSPLLPLTRAQAHLIRGLLRDKKIRTREGAFVVEGAKFCQDLFRHHPGSILSLTVSPRYLRTEDEASRVLRTGLSARQFTCSDDTFAALSDVDTPQGILAAVRQPEWDEDPLWRPEPVLGLYGDQIRDPLNVGAIIRTAAALNLRAVWLSSDSADCFGPKVVRAAAGSVLTLPIFRIKDLGTFEAHGCAIYSAVLPDAGTVSLRTIQQRPIRLVLAVGNEGQGLAPQLLKASTLRFSIPLARNVESLNVAATAAIAAFYFSGLPTQ